MVVRRFCRTFFFAASEWEVGGGSWELLREWEEAFPTPTLIVKKWEWASGGVGPRWESVKCKSVNVFAPSGRPIYTSHSPPSPIVRAIVN